MRKRLNRRLLNAEESSEVNISPLLDMVFILLIFFVVTSTFTRETGVEVKKPKASSAVSIQEKIIKIAITREGGIYIFEKQVTLDLLETILKREKSKAINLKAVIIADDNAKTGMLVKILDKCNLANIRETSIAATVE